MKKFFKMFIMTLLVIMIVNIIAGCYSSSGSYNNDTNYDNHNRESYPCMGKNDTCPNMTYDPYDFYCSSCDPDGDNVEG